MKQHLSPHDHVVNACGLTAAWVLNELGRHGMIPARHAPRRSFHEAIPVANQLGQAVQLDQVRVFRIGFRSGLLRHQVFRVSSIGARAACLRIPYKKVYIY